MAGESNVPGMPDGGEPGDSAFRRIINKEIEASNAKLGAAFQAYVDANITELAQAINRLTDLVTNKLTTAIPAARTAKAPIDAAFGAVPPTSVPVEAPRSQESPEPQAEHAIQLAPGAAMGQQLMGLLLPAAVQFAIKFAESKLIAPPPTHFDPSKVTLSDIKKISELKPDEFGFVANQVMPDPINEFLPAEQARIWSRAYQAGQRSRVWTETGEDPGDQPIIPTRRVVRKPPPAASTLTPLPPPVSNGSTADASSAAGPSSSLEPSGSRFAVLAQRGRA